MPHILGQGILSIINKLPCTSPICLKLPGKVGEGSYNMSWHVRLLPQISVYILGNLIILEFCSDLRVYFWCSRGQL